MAHFLFFILFAIFLLLTLWLIDFKGSPPGRDKPPRGGEWPVVARFNSREEAHLAGNVLKNEDIEVIVEEDWATGLYNRLEFGGNKIRISPDELEKAVGILSETRFRKNILKESK